MLRTLHTIGYEKRTLDDYLALLVEAQINVLVDVRQTPWSYKPGFSKKPLAEACEQHGILYVHAQFAGNPKELRASAPTHADCLEAYRQFVCDRPEIMRQFEDLVDEFLAQGARVCLTCFERHHDDCHRAIVADLWADRLPGRAVEHIASDGCARLVPQRLQNA